MRIFGIGVKYHYGLSLNTVPPPLPPLANDAAMNDNHFVAECFKPQVLWWCGAINAVAAFASIALVAAIAWYRVLALSSITNIQFLLFLAYLQSSHD